MKVGIYGGSFDPPHVAHMIVASQSVAQLGLDYLFMVPTGEVVSATEKRSIATPLQRYEMVRLCVGLGGPIYASNWETYKTTAIKTVDTVREFAHIWRNAEFWLIMGADSWLSFPTWEEPEEIRKLSKIAVFPRHSMQDFEGTYLPDRILAIPSNDISSTWIRKNAGGTLEWLVPENVIQYIREHNLYTEGKAK